MRISDGSSDVCSSDLGNVSQIGNTREHRFSEHIDDVRPHIQKQAGNSGQAQRKCNGHASAQQQAQPYDQRDPRIARAHDGSPDSLTISATYCRLSRTNTASTGESVINKETAANLSGLQPPPNAPN